MINDVVYEIISLVGTTIIISPIKSPSSVGLIFLLLKTNSRHSTSIFLHLPHTTISEIPPFLPRDLLIGTLIAKR